MGFVMDAINKGIALVKNPAGFMESNKESPTTVKDIMMNYVVVLAAIPFFATLIGDLLFYRGASNYIGYAFVYAVLYYIVDVLAVYILGIVIKTLANSFGSSTDPIKALKLAAYVYTPAYLIAVVFIIPFLSVLGLLGLLYGLYIFYIGAPIMLGTPKDKVIPYLFVTIVAVVIIYVILGIILTGVTSALFLKHIVY